jgi:hypothetical protein
MTTPPPSFRQAVPPCPAVAGQGTDLNAARFTLVAEDCERGPDGRMTLTEVFGLYQVPGQAAEDLIYADGFAVPIGSPVAVLARQVARSRRRTRIAGDQLRAVISACPCAPAGSCAALDDLALLEAIEHAARPRSCGRFPPGPHAQERQLPWPGTGHAPRWRNGRRNTGEAAEDRGLAGAPCRDGLTGPGPCPPPESSGHGPDWSRAARVSGAPLRAATSPRRCCLLFRVVPG